MIHVCPLPPSLYASQTSLWCEFYLCVLFIVQELKSFVPVISLSFYYIVEQNRMSFHFIDREYMVEFPILRVQFSSQKSPISE